MRARWRSCVMALLVPLLLLPRAASTEVSSLPTGAFSVMRSVTVPGTPATIYDAMTGDISPWWDHTFSNEPSRFHIDARPGGAFIELFGSETDGVVHATVIYADRGKMLRFRGPLGLQGNAVDLVTTWTYEAKGDSTHITCVCRASGQMEDGWPAAIDGLWEHFLEKRFKPYIEGRLEPGAGHDEG